jgi:protein ImuB
MPRRYLAIWLKHWPVDRWRRAQPRDAKPADARADPPLVLVETVGPRRQVVAPDPRALAQGIAPGMGLADAQALVSDLRVEPADRAADAAALHRLAEWAIRFSPLVAPDPPDGLMLDIAGCAHLWGGEARLLADALSRLRGSGIAASGAIAGTIGAAWAVARFGTASAGVIIPAGTISNALAILPVAALRIDIASTEGLARLGLRKIGDLYPMKRAGLAQRFGPLLLTRLDQALGSAGETLSPLAPPPDRRVGMGFAEPISAPESIRHATEVLVQRLTRELGLHQLGVRALRLSAYRLDGAVSGIAIGTARASAEPRHLFHLLAERLEAIDPGPGIEFMHLAAERTESISPSQSGLLDLDEAAISVADLAPLMDRLANRLGAGSLARTLPVESHVPERAQKLAPPLEASKAEWPDLPPRPTRLLPHPEPIEVMAPIPDDPPVTFRWRHITHRVTWSEGPERIEPEWWKAEDINAETRDYYRVEDETGGRYWLYRAGLYQANRNPRWFLHGVFA